MQHSSHSRNLAGALQASQAAAAVVTALAVRTDIGHWLRAPRARLALATLVAFLTAFADFRDLAGALQASRAAAAVVTALAVRTDTGHRLRASFTALAAVFRSQGAPASHIQDSSSHNHMLTQNRC